MRESFARAALTLGILLLLSAALCWGTAIAASGLRERDEARRRVTAAAIPSGALGKKLS